ncbi:MAG: DUF4124 domain-containing protein [Halioglobus sp.]
MSRLLLLALLLTSLPVLSDSIYRTTDAQGNVVFTDTPPPEGVKADRVEVQRINTTEPPQEILRPRHRIPPARSRRPSLPSSVVPDRRNLLPPWAPATFPSAYGSVPR